MSESNYKYTFIEDTFIDPEDDSEEPEPEKMDITNYYLLSDYDYTALINWINREKDSIKPPDHRREKEAKENIYKYTFISDEYIDSEDDSEEPEPEEMTIANYYLTSDFTALINWINREKDSIKPPPPPSKSDDSPPPAEDPELLAATQNLIEKVRRVLEANRQIFFPPPSETLNLEQFKSFSQTEFSDEEHRKTLEKLLADDEKFRKELEAMMLGLEDNPFKGDKEIIRGAIDGILAEFKSIIDTNYCLKSKKLKIEITNIEEIKTVKLPSMVR